METTSNKNIPSWLLWPPYFCWIVTKRVQLSFSGIWRLCSNQKKKKNDNNRSKLPNSYQHQCVRWKTFRMLLTPLIMPLTFLHSKHQIYFSCVKHHHCPPICNIHAPLPFLFTDCVESSSWNFPGILQRDSHLNSLHPKPPHDKAQVLCETCNLRILELLFHTGGRWPWLPNFIGIGKVGSPKWSPFRECSHVLSLRSATTNPSTLPCQRRGISITRVEIVWCRSRNWHDFATKRKAYNPQKYEW